MAQSGMRRPFAKRQPLWLAISKAFSSLNSTVLSEPSLSILRRISSGRALENSRSNSDGGFPIVLTPLTDTIVSPEDTPACNAGPFSIPPTTTCAGLCKMSSSNPG
jgi:hypothetical protein